MPGGDGTGPTGAGPMTGRGAGICNGYDRPGFANGSPGQVGRRGQGRGGFRGNGCQWWHQRYLTGQTNWRAPYAGDRPDAESMVDVTSLREQAKQLSSALANLERRIGELEDTPGAPAKTQSEPEG